MLSDAEPEVALTKIEALPSDIYTVKALYGADWHANPRPRGFGKRFKRTVLHGALPRLRWVRKRSDRSQEYELT
jgi:hypothetical protein